MKTNKQQKKTKKLDNILGRLEHIQKLVENIATEKSAGDELISINETSNLVKLAVSTIYSKVSRNEIPAFKMGKRLYFCRSEIMEWIKSGRKKTIAEIRSEIDAN